MFRWWIKDNRTWRSAILAGAGHGGIEAIILGILVMLAFTNLMAYRNIDLSKLNLTLDQLATARQQIQSYWNAPWYATLLGAVERAFTIPFPYHGISARAYRYSPAGRVTSSSDGWGWLSFSMP